MTNPGIHVIVSSLVYELFMLFNLVTDLFNRDGNLILLFLTKKIKAISNQSLYKCNK